MRSARFEFVFDEPNGILCVTLNGFLSAEQVYHYLWARSRERERARKLTDD